MTVLAIDQGTSGTKAIVVDDAGEVLAIAESTLRPAYLAGGGVEQDPQALLDSILDTGRRAVADAGRPVDTVSVANQGETVLAWDRATGAPLSAAIVWQDSRSDALCRSLSASKEWVGRKTGLVLDPYFSAPKMAWLRQNVTTRGVVTTTDVWLAHHLTGTAFVTDVTTASRSLLTDIDTTEWDCELLELFGLDHEPLPTIVANDAVVGTTTAFGAPAAVGGLIVDQQAALLAQRCTSPGSAKCTFGTGVFLLANVGAAPVRPTSGLTCSVAWNLRGETAYCVDGQAYTAASAIRWITDLGLIDSPADLDAVAAPDAGGVLFVPALAGLASPWWRPDATATFTGMTLSTTREHLVTAVIEGVAAQTAELLGSVSADLDAPLRSLRVDGGLTRSQRLMQALANLTGLPIEVYPSAHATALGAAACARLSGDPHLTLAEAVPDPASQPIYQPQWSADQADDFRSRWLTVVAASLPRERHA